MAGPSLALSCGSLQAYVDMFSKSLDLEYSAWNISVQNQAPAYVATKMSKIKKPTMDAPSPAVWVASAVKHIGYEPTSCPYWCAALCSLAAQASQHAQTFDR
jgi:17beta-estradiol 17-dehydrogenase / very-long-chain 3-oxoacyl-CoA reductase